MKTPSESDPSERSSDDDSSASSRRETTGDPTGGIYARPRRRQARRSEESSSGPGIWGRITGRHRLDQIRAERYKPYSYESNQQNIRWTAWAMTAWALALIWLAWVDYSNVNRYSEWHDQGIQSIPPDHNYWSQIENSRIYAQSVGGDEFECAYLSGLDSTSECPDGELPNEKINSFVEANGVQCVQYDSEKDECTGVWTSRGMVGFANAEGFDCPDSDASFTFFHSDPTQHPECGEVFDLASEYNQSQDRSRLIWLLVMLCLLFVAFPYLSAIHRASRNLLTLKSEGQRDRPEWAVLHHFIPILNLIRTGRVVRELFKGSDPEVATDDPTAWKRLGKVHTIAMVWWVLWIASILFNPILIPRYIGIRSLEDVITVNQYFVIADILLIVLGVVAVLMLRQLHNWQEMRHEKVGPITVTPPLPPDPLQEALDRQAEAERSDESDNRDDEKQ